jgi:VWFA-related protein
MTPLKSGISVSSTRALYIALALCLSVSSVSSSWQPAAAQPIDATSGTVWTPDTGRTSEPASMPSLAQGERERNLLAVDGARNAIMLGEYSEASLQLTTVISASQDLRAPALLLRSVAQFLLGDEVMAEIDLLAATAIIPDFEALRGRATSEGRPESAHAFTLPTDFLLWADSQRNTARDRARRVEATATSDISLDDLFPGRDLTEVTSHFSIDVEVVRIPAIVQGLGDRFIVGLTAEQFRVAEGNDSLTNPITHLIPESEPTSIGVLVDASASMREMDAEVRSSIRDLVMSLRPEDELFVIQFGDSAEFLTSFTRNVDEIVAAMSAYRLQEGRALYDAVALGLIQMRSAFFDKKALIVISDGDDTSSETAETDIRRAAQAEGIAIHAIVLTKGVERWRPSGDNPVFGERQQSGQQVSSAANTDAERDNSFFLQELVHNTGGLVALRPVASDRYGGLPDWLRQTCGSLSDYINNQYLILYEPPHPPPRGEWRRLRLILSTKFEIIRSRPGYVR